MLTKALKQAVPRTREQLNGGSLIANEKLRQLYATMLRFRVLEERLRLGTAQSGLARNYDAAIGHEAAAVGCTIDLEKDDVVDSAPHDPVGDFLHYIPLACRLPQLYQHPVGNEEKSHSRAGVRRPSARALQQASSGNNPGKASGKFGPSIELASRLKKTRNVVVAFSADGGLSDSMWRKEFRAAKDQSLPIIFVHRDKLSHQTGASPFADARRTSKSKSAGPPTKDHGVPHIPVDGHDVVAVYRVAHESIQRARRGGGPTLIDCMPYLPDMRAPSTRGRNGMADSTGGRNDTDPIRYMELYLTRKGLFRNSWKNRLIEEFSRKLDVAIDAAEQE